jgi:hypothetical protein
MKKFTAPIMKPKEIVSFLSPLEITLDAENLENPFNLQKAYEMFIEWLLGVPREELEVCLYCFSFRFLLLISKFRRLITFMKWGSYKIANFTKKPFAKFCLFVICKQNPLFLYHSRPSPYLTHFLITHYFFRSKLFKLVCVRDHDFHLDHICPTKRRAIQTLSAILNFAMFREERLSIYEKYHEQTVCVNFFRIVRISTTHYCQYLGTNHKSKTRASPTTH